MSGLEQVGRRAFGWIETNLDHFSIADPTDDLLLVQDVKPIAELALLCDLIRRRPAAAAMIGASATKAESTLRFCWQELAGGEHLRRLLAFYPDLFSLVTVYPPFKRAGLVNGALDEAIERLLHSSGMLALEFPPWRLIDFAVALESLGHRSPWSAPGLLADTWLGHRPWPWLLSDSSAYSLTHTVFYLTDFGGKPQALPDHTTRYLTRWLPIWCAYYMRVKNLDLLCELLMVCRCLGVAIPEGTAEFVARHQRANGNVPGPDALKGMFRSAGLSSRRSAFLRDYHTTLVAMMAALLDSSLAAYKTRRTRFRAAASSRPSLPTLAKAANRRRS